MRDHRHSEIPPRINVVNVGSGTHTYRRYNRYNMFSAHDPLCCCLGLTSTFVLCSNPDFLKAMVVAAVAIVIIACLATLAMSVTAEALLSVLLVAAIIGGIASLCQGNNCGQPRSDNTPSF